MRYDGPINRDPDVTGSMRDAFCEALIEAGEQCADVFVLTADQGKSVKPFAARFPDRFVDVGIAEANMVGIASGLALSGKRPFVTTIAAILTLRACEQIKDDVCYQNAGVRIVGHGGGISYGVLGPTHHSIEDIGAMRAIPGMTIVVPSDPVEARKAVLAAVDFMTPLYIRIGTGTEQVVYGGDYEFRIGEPVVMKPPGEVCILANAQCVVEALAAGDALEADGIRAGVVNVHTVKPLSRETVLAATRPATTLVTLEEHNIMGGLGSAVAEVLSETPECRVVRLGVPDCFAPVGSRKELYKRYGMDRERVADRIRAVMSNQ